MTDDKRLIEDYIPVEAISVVAQREKIGHAALHPRKLHLWWARRPLAAARAAVYATLVPVDGTPDSERSDDFFVSLCQWGASDQTIAEARERVLAANGGVPPKVLDLFAGGGAIPLEAARLGCDATAVELNPVAHLIERCTLDYPQRFGPGAGRRRPRVGARAGSTGHGTGSATSTRACRRAAGRAAAPRRGPGRRPRRGPADRLPLDAHRAVPEHRGRRPRDAARAPDVAGEEEGPLHRAQAGRRPRGALAVAGRSSRRVGRGARLRPGRLLEPRQGDLPGLRRDGRRQRSRRSAWPGRWASRRWRRSSSSRAGAAGTTCRSGPTRSRRRRSARRCWQGLT